MKSILIVTLAVITSLFAWLYFTGKNSAEQTQKPSAIETIMARRSIRQYKDQPVEREKLAEIARCGIAAPNAMNKQEWAVRIVDSKEWIDRCTAAYVPTIEGTPTGDYLLKPDFRNMFRNAAAVIFVAALPSNYSGVNSGLMGENMMLAAHELGLGTCCLGMPISFLNSEQGAEFLASLALPEGYVLQYALAVGYADEQPDMKPRDESKIVFVE
jgi:nitroreductase